MISLISTVFNEAKNIKRLMSDINDQSLQPDEKVFVDAGSFDGTAELLKEAGFTVLKKEGCGRSEGRNEAIKHASSDLIAVCDGGTRLDRNWLKKLTEPLRDDPAVEVASGFFKPDPQNFFEKCMSAATIPILEEIEEDRFLPSSRSLAFRKEVWEKVSGYPEWLPVCEDLVFDIKLKKRGVKFKFVPEAIVLWRPRSSVSAFFKQYYSYAKGDGHAKLWLARHLIRYTAYLTGFLILFLSVTVSPLWLLPFFAAQLGYFSKFYYRYMGHFPSDPEYKAFTAFVLVSFLVIVGDTAKMIGYPIGVLDRLSGTVKFEEYRN